MPGRDLTPGTVSQIKSVLRDVRLSWKPLVLTDVAFKVIAFVILTPLVGVLFRAFIATSGRAVVSDLDILYFFLGPLGAICLVIVAALSLAIVGLEQAALIGIHCATSQDRRLGPVGAILWSGRHAWPVIRLTIRMVIWTVLVATPFLVLAALVWYFLISDFDINYYLREKPPAFLVAVGIGVVISLALASVLLRLFSGWFFALPLVLFDGVSPGHALGASVGRTRGHRFRIFCWIVGWAMAMSVLSAMATGVVGLLGGWMIPDSATSLNLLAVTVGITLVLLAVVNLAVNLLGSITLAAITFQLYLQYGRPGESREPRAEFAPAPAWERGFRLTRARIIAVSVLAIAIAVSAGVAALHSVRLEDDVQIMAHRGSSHDAPENTIAAFERAIADGADWIELDVQESADGEVIVMHDSDFMKLAGQNLRVWNATMGELKDLDIGSWFAPQFSNQRVPTLGQVLDMCKGRIGVNIELKYYGYDEQLEQRVADIVDSRGMASEVMVMSLKMDGILRMKSIRPEWKTGLLMSVAAGDMDRIETEFLAVNAAFATSQMVRRAHNSGKEIYVWTVNDAATMSAMMSRGVDGILTDRPALARSVLRQRAQMSAPQRLLLELAHMFGTVPEIDDQ